METTQVWAMIGAFSAVMFGGFGVMIRLIRAEIGGVRVEIAGVNSRLDSTADGLRSEMNGLRDGLRSEMSGLRDGLRSEMSGLRSEMNARFDALESKVDAKADAAVMDARFTDVEHRVAAIETDMHLVKAHLIGQRSA